jgi:diacylglycerol kinase family enzyme
MHFHLVVNPVAGRNRAAALGEELRERLTHHGASADLYRTTAPGDALAHAAALHADAADRLVVVGGDGTLREILNARALPLPWPVGLVPVGTANVVGRELRMPLAAPADLLARALLQAEPWTVNVLECARGDGTVERALANLGAGLDAAIVVAVAQERAAHAGLGGYVRWVRPILRTIARFRFPRFTVTVDGARTYEGTAVVVQGGHNYGGLFRLARAAALDAAVLHVTIVTAQNRRDLLRVLARAAFRPAQGDRDVLHVTGREVHVASDLPAALQADGDPAGMAPVTVRLLPRAVTLLRAPAAPLD